MNPEEQNQESLTERAAEFITHSRKMVVFTGAGISTESGIPDFRSPGGVWSKYDPDDFTIQKVYQQCQDAATDMGDDGQERRDGQGGAQPCPSRHRRTGEAGQARLHHHPERGQPTPNSGKQPRQGLRAPREHAMGSLLELHQRYPLERVAETTQAITETPECPSCRGILKPDAVFFGETLLYDTLSRATEHSRSCDVFVVIGSTLTVTPAAFMPQYARDAGARIITVNLSPTPMDRQTSVLIRSKAGEAVPPIVDRVKAKLESHRRQRIK